MPIQILDDNTINKIAAGEVIERPASALKELLENAVDSGATRIEVHFEEGGKNLIRVTDNGSGIPSDELPLALQRHGTSKISKIEDLFSLSTMGFRGEALASLGAVSELTLTSTLAGAARGGQLKCNGGRIESVRPVAPLDGTAIEIKNLFYNVPARQKFLKSTSGETAALKKVFKTFALIHPEIALTLKQEGKNISFYPTQDFFKRVCEVLDVSKKDAFHLSASGEFSMEAVLVHPKLNIATQGGVFVFVQGRPVQDKLINQAVMEGYRNLVMDHQYPQAVISLKVPPEFVDVNVHPAKLQVKFQSPSLVFRFVSSEIKKLFSEKLETEINPVKMDFFTPMEFQPQLLNDNVTQYNQKSFETSKAQEPVQVAEYISTQPEITNSRPATTSATFTPTPAAAAAVPAQAATWSGLQVIGQFANTYIITQSQKGLILIDQHAAHERVLFERLKNRGIIEKQQALIPEIIELEPWQIEVLTQNQWAETFDKLGFGFHQRGPQALAITARPAFLTDAGMKPLVERLCEQISEAGAHSSMEDVINNVWASMSCHGAIRAGKVMSPSEMKALLTEMEESSFSSFCPHGRPVSVQLSLNDLEKLFKRIV